jgi:carbonic anhydrase/acetyltransferase-like protein (isoleucine patch superfamily)
MQQLLEMSFGDSCSVWFNAVIRGDVNLKIGNKVNIKMGL